MQLNRLPRNAASREPSKRWRSSGPLRPTSLTDSGRVSRTSGTPPGIIVRVGRVVVPGLPRAARRNGDAPAGPGHDDPVSAVSLCGGRRISRDRNSSSAR